MIEVKSEQLTVQFKTLGGLVVNQRIEDGIEYLWQGDATYWSGQAPVLFSNLWLFKNDTAFYSQEDGRRRKGKHSSSRFSPKKRI